MSTDFLLKSPFSVPPLSLSRARTFFFELYWRLFCLPIHISTRTFITWIIYTTIYCIRAHFIQRNYLNEGKREQNLSRDSLKSVSICFVSRSTGSVFFLANLILILRNVTPACLFHRMHRRATPTAFVYK